jgi:endonuclease-8
MPEGDTIFRAATSLRRWLVGRRLTDVRTTVAGFAAARLVGHTVDAVDTQGKHLLMRCSGGLTIHSHMRMTGSWHLYPTGEAWGRPARQARLVLIAADRLAVCFNAPVVELLDAAGEVGHPSLRRLGPDVLGPSAPDPGEVVRRARARSGADRSIGELLLDQQVVSGIGNIYRCESLFLCGVHPAMPPEAVPDGLLGELVATAVRLMRASAEPSNHGGRSFGGAKPSDLVPNGASGGPWVYGQAGRPCRRCGTSIRRDLLGRQPRAVYWCPHCQAPRPPGGPAGS